jgi:outer membrane protein TolC
VSANLAQRTATRIAAEQQVVGARQQLALAMGLSQDQLLSLPDPVDPLPVASATAIPAPGSVPQYINLALARRADLMSLKRRQRAADILVIPAKNSLKPQVNLVFSAGYAGYREGNTPGSVLISPFVGAHGPDVSGGINYSFPLGNRNAIGAVMQAEAGSRQAQLRIDDAARTVASNVIVAFEGLRSAALQLERAREAVRLFQNALDNEREKYRLGVSSLIDILTVEDRLTGSLTTNVQAESAYATALAQLRSATGTIIEPDRQVQSPDASLFSRVPAVGAGKP